MKRETLDEVIACLPQDRTLFHYFEGQYAFKLLAYATRRGTSVGAIKQSPFQRLLNQVDVKALLASHGSNRVTSELFEYAWKESSQPFVLTVDRWGTDNRWQSQTTRRGCNLVLQLNFSEKHDRAYQRLVMPNDDYIFNTSLHPVMCREQRHRYRNTLAWSRIDFDLEVGEALIEEIQSDWVRRVQYCLQSIKQGVTPWQLKRCRCEDEAFIAYAEGIFAPFYKMWSEAMMMATIQFIHTELGINTIYYHTHETGQKMKRIYGAPPRSLYTDLPRKFCFQINNEDPGFIKGDREFIRKRRSLKEAAWYKLTLQGESLCRDERLQ